LPSPRLNFRTPPDRRGEGVSGEGGTPHAQEHTQGYRSPEHLRRYRTPSTKTWEEAAKNAVEQAGEHLRELRVAEVVEQDMVIRNGKVQAYRTKVKVSFKYEGHG
jgi:hypothetical protein